MEKVKPIPPDFFSLLVLKEQSLIELFCDLRAFLLGIHPESNELLYHTHALTTAFSLSEKLGDAYCVIPIYTKGDTTHQSLNCVCSQKHGKACEIHWKDHF